MLEKQEAERKDMLERQSQLEEKIYTLSVENKGRQEDKEQLVMLLPHIYQQIKGRPNQLKTFLAGVESEALKAKVMKLLSQYRINYR